MEKQKNIVAPIITGVLVSSVALILNEYYRQGTLQVWLKEWKKNLLQKNNIGGFASNRKYTPLLFQEEEQLGAFPSDKVYIKLER